MVDRPTRDELTGVVSLGLLAENAVMAIGRVLRSQRLTEDDHRVLEHARRLFELMAEEDVIVLDHSDDRMLSDESYLDALRVVELQAEGADIEPLVRHYVELLQKAIDEKIGPDERQELERLRDLLVEVGETSLSRANELSRTRQEPTWRSMHRAISRF